MIHDHVVHELAIEFVARQLRKLIVVGLLLPVGLGRRRHSQRLSDSLGFLVGRRVILREHLAEGANAIAAAVLLSQLAHLHFGQVALHRLLEEFLSGFVLGEACRAHDKRAGEAGTHDEFGYELRAHVALLSD